MHFWGVTDFVHGFEVYFYGLVIAEFLFWVGRERGIPPSFWPSSLAGFCVLLRIYCDALARAPLPLSSCCMEWTPLILKRGGLLWPWGALLPPCCPKSLSFPHLSPLCPLARSPHRCLCKAASPLRYSFLPPSPRSPASFPVNPGNPNKFRSKFKVLL